MIGLTADTLHPFGTVSTVSPLALGPGQRGAQHGAVPFRRPQRQRRTPLERPEQSRTRATRYLITSALNGEPDPTVSFAGLTGPLTGPPSLVNISPTNASQQFPYLSA